MRRLSILGSTGSIGRSALGIVQMFPERFCVKALAAKRNLTLLADQIRTFQPEVAAVFDEDRRRELKSLLPGGCRTRILHGESGYAAAAACESADLTLIAIVGAAGLRPTLSAIDAGKTIALANKETLVIAGAVVMARAAERRVAIRRWTNTAFSVPAGSAPRGRGPILLTASGGRSSTGRPRRSQTSRRPKRSGPNCHGPKITIDSAT
jgi:1-deoxy-D-xylulose-5-phosphate reductoisomerase